MIGLDVGGLYRSGAQSDPLLEDEARVLGRPVVDIQAAATKALRKEIASARAMAIGS
jgi:hypothetical protein